MNRGLVRGEKGVWGWNRRKAKKVRIREAWRGERGRRGREKCKKAEEWDKVEARGRGKEESWRKRDEE